MLRIKKLVCPRRGTPGAEPGRAGGGPPGGEVWQGRPGQREQCFCAGMELNKEWTCSGNTGLSVVTAGAVEGVARDH